MTDLGLAQTTRPAAGHAGQSAIAVDAAEHDFGQVWAGEKLEHTFKITNTGTGELTITSVRPACGCTAAGSYPKSLAPGASGEFPFSLSTARMNGAFNKAILIHSNDPARPVLTLSLKGQARPQIAVEPPGAFFGSVYGEQGRTKDLALTNNTDAPLKIVLDPLASTGPWAFDLAEKEPGKKYELTARFSPKGLQPGLVRQTALLLTNVQAQHEVQVQAIATLRDRIEAEPATLTIYKPAISRPTTQPAQASSWRCSRRPPSRR